MADKVVIDRADSDLGLEIQIEKMETKNKDLISENLVMKEKLEKLSVEIEELKGVKAEMNQRFVEMEKEIDEYEEEKKALESISNRAVELEKEVMSLQEDLNASLIGVDKTGEEVLELKKALAEKVEKLEVCEKEADLLRKDRAEVEKKVRDFERKIGVFEVREMEEKSKKLRLEEETREKADEKEQEIIELQKNVGVLNLELVKNKKDLERCESEKKRVEEALSVSEKREKKMETKKEELLKKVEEAKENERIKKPNSVARETNTEVSVEVKLLPVVASAGLVAATLFVVYAKLR
ncbi:unnamed protein product [Cochlearia groenlandica]